MTIPLIFPGDSPRVRASDPVSSHEAADASASSVWASQQATLSIMDAHGKPITALQVEGVADIRELPFSASRMRSTLSELETLGLVERAGFTSPPRGRRRQLWARTGRGDA